MQPALAPSMRIALIAPPLLGLPPVGYAGIERVVSTLAVQLHARGHEVTAFAPGDSDLPCEVVPIVPVGLWSSGLGGDEAAYVARGAELAWAQSARFDIIHSHVETHGFLLARHCSTPVLTTLHGRLDGSGVPELLEMFNEIPLVAISDSQRRWSPSANWLATVHHGLDFHSTGSSDDPGSYLLFVGRVADEKGIAEAIELARMTGRRLVAAAKVRQADEVALYRDLIIPAVDDGIVDWRGEVEGHERDRLMAGALATLMLGASPEPFGLVAIESMATGTPVIARRVGALTETVSHGNTGFLVDDLQEAELAVCRASSLDRRRIRAYARGRFSAEVMTDAYEHLYDTVISDVQASSRRPLAAGPSRAPRLSAEPEASSSGTLARAALARQRSA